MKIAISGATGLIGREITAQLLRAGHSVRPLSRNAPPELNEINAVIHLAGEPIFGRWSARKKVEIRNSRILGTRRLVDAVSKAPSVQRFVSASAIGFYGDRGDEILDESSSPGDDFLAGVCRDWESEAGRAPGAVQLRIGPVLAKHGGALAQMLPVFSRGLGGPLGSGKQWMSWIHLADVARLFLFAVDGHLDVGPVNATAPQPVTNLELSRCLAEALGHKLFLPVPKLALQLVYGELAAALLSSQRVSCQKALSSGFKFNYPDLRSALIEILNRTPPESRWKT